MNFKSKFSIVFLIFLMFTFVSCMSEESEGYEEGVDQSVGASDNGNRDNSENDSDEAAIGGDKGFTDSTKSDGSNVDVAAKDDAEVPDDAFEEYGMECSSLDHCRRDEVCDFAHGKCEQRVQKKPAAVGDPKVFGIKPEKASPGDFLIIDGTDYYDTGVNPFASLNMSVQIGSTDISNKEGEGVGTFFSNEARIVVEVPEGVTGQVTVKRLAKGDISEQTFSVIEKGVGVCDETTFAATGEVNSDMYGVGPFGAGYEDMKISGRRARVYYPAECGGLRMPVKAGKYPIAFLLAPDSNNFIAHDYLGHYLSSWGFVVVNLRMNYEYVGGEFQTSNGNRDTWTPEAFGTDFNIVEGEYSAVRSITEMMRGKDLSAVSSFLSGVETTEKIAMIAGGGASVEFLQWSEIDYVTPKYKLSPMGENVVANLVIAAAGQTLDPNLIMPLPGYYMGISGTLDRAAHVSHFEAQFKKQHNENPQVKYETFIEYLDKINDPAWIVSIVGANNDMFTDNQWLLLKIQGQLVDYNPDIDRKESLKRISVLSLSFLERAFKTNSDIADEHFPQMIDGASQDVRYQISKK